MPGPDLGTLDLPLRFKLVNAVPVAIVALTLGGLLLAGAPAKAPHLDTLLTHAREFGWAGAVLATAAIAIVALVAEPLEMASIRLLEGYWSPTGPLVHLARTGRWLQRRRRSRLIFLATHCRTDPSLTEAAQQGLLRYPSNADRVLPTALGNRLRAFEDRAGAGYNLNALAWWPRLHHVLPETALNAVNQYRNQLDLAARLSLAFALTSGVSAVVLIRHLTWWWLPSAFIALAWLAYQAALGAADTYGVAVTAAIDVYRLRLIQTMGVRLPGDANDERMLNVQLAQLWNGFTQANVDYASDDRNVSGRSGNGQLGPDSHPTE